MRCSGDGSLSEGRCTRTLYLTADGIHGGVVAPPARRTGAAPVLGMSDGVAAWWRRRKRSYTSFCGAMVGGGSR